MPAYTCIDETYLARLEVLTSNLERLKADYLACVAKQKEGASTIGQVNELEYELSKAKLALATYRIDNVSKNQISF